MWLLTCFLISASASSLPPCPALFSSFLSLWGDLLQCLDFSIYMLRLTHQALLSKELQSFPRFLCYQKRNRGTVLDGENFGSSLQKNNSHVASCFCLFDVLLLVQREGLGSSSVHLPCICSKMNRKLVFEPQTYFVFRYICVSIIKVAFWKETSLWYSFISTNTTLYLCVHLESKLKQSDLLY